MRARSFSTCTECREVEPVVAVIETSGCRTEEAAEVCIGCIRLALSLAEQLRDQLALPGGTPGGHTGADGALTGPEGTRDLAVTAVHGMETELRAAREQVEALRGALERIGLGEPMAAYESDEDFFCCWCYQSLPEHREDCPAGIARRALTGSQGGNDGA